jgi:hypothetical protein
MGQFLFHATERAHDDHAAVVHRSTCATSLTPRMSDMLHLLFSGGLPQTHVNLPHCWDEILDWGEQVTLLTSLLNNDKVLPGHDNGTRILLEAGNSYRFTPLVLRSEKDRLSELKAMSWLSRARFFADSVMISVARSDEIVGYLCFGRFCTYHSILCRLTDLCLLKYENSVRLESKASRRLTKKPGECLLCCNATENAVLSCGHALCTSCEKRWVKKQLVCPFCRQKFLSAKDVNRNGTWDLLEWTGDTDLDSDIQALESKLEEFWHSLFDLTNSTGATVDSLRHGIYTEVPRSLAVIDNDPDDFLLIEEHEGFDSLTLTI